MGTKLNTYVPNWSQAEKDAARKQLGPELNVLVRRIVVGQARGEKALLDSLVSIDAKLNSARALGATQAENTSSSLVQDLLPLVEFASSQEMQSHIYGRLVDALRCVKLEDEFLSFITNPIQDARPKGKVI